MEMDQYMESLMADAETLSPEDEDYEEKLLQIAGQFRGLEEALTAFLEEHGYVGDSASAADKAQFIRERFKSADMKPPRDIEKWFAPGKTPSRKTAFQICFAFGLGIGETNDFFRRVWLDRGFDCHDISEAAYYFCMKQGLPYSEAQDLIGRIPVPKKAKSVPNCDILYTGTILDYLDSIDDGEKLVSYIKENIEGFRYNNATAIKYVQDLWGEISGEDGLAVQEGILIEKTQNGYEDARYNPVIAKAGKSAPSTWTIFSQIIGLPNYLEKEYAVRHDRSLAFVLSENALLPLNASYCFPSQHNIDRLLRGELGDNEMIRKMLVFLVFYVYWAKIIVREKDVYYLAKHPDAERCLATINNRLLLAGYPEMYAGNPYDWIFLWSLNDEHPLDAFRIYLGEVLAADPPSSSPLA